MSKVFHPGLYLFELYGAGGGSTTYDGFIIEGGKGGYTRAAYRFYKNTKVYLAIGGMGSSAQGLAPGGWNGGGYGKSGYLNHVSAGGGGSTDIRFGCSSNQCRVLVAGGGGGAGNSESCIAGFDGRCFGGSGGGLNGTNGYPLHKDSSIQQGCGGTQSSPGLGGYDLGLGYSRKTPDGRFFFGGSMQNEQTIFDSSCGGGGSGYYGGGCGAATGG